MRWARMTIAVALCIVGVRARAGGICPDDSLLIPRATVRLGHGAAWPEHTEAIGAFCMDRDEFSVARLVDCVGSGACFPTPSCSTAQGAVACLDALQAEEVCRAEGGRLPTESEWEYAARGREAALVTAFDLRAMASGVREWTSTPGPSAFSAERMVKGAFPVTGPWARDPVEEHTSLPTLGFRCVYPVSPARNR